MLLVRIGNPVDSGIVSDSSMVGINADHLIVFVSSVLGNPVAVENSQAAECSTNTLFSFSTKVAGRLELIDTDGSGLSSDDTFGDGSLSSTSADSASVDNVSLLGFEAEFSGLVSS